ncbi:MAG: hypothetical protein ACI8S6_002229, partial [Myxococcota bacterium]
MLPSLLLTIAAAAADPVGVTIKRIDADDPTITLLLDVRSADGAIVGGWAADDVTVTIDGAAAAVSRVDRFVDSGEAFGTMLLFDTSCSMRRAMPQVHEAANDYIDGMAGGDTASFAWFNDASYGEDNPWSRNRDKLRELVSQLRAVGQQTRFYESLNKVISEIDANPDSPRYRAVLVLSDGIDEGSPDPFTFDRAVRLSRAGDVPINAVGFLPGRDRSGLPVLQALASDTDGYFALAESEGEISARFQQFQDSLHNLLLVEIQPDELAIGDREVAVSLSGTPGLGAARTRLELEVPWVGTDETEEEEDSNLFAGVSAAALALLAAAVAGFLLLLGLVAVVAFRRSPPAPPPTAEPVQPAPPPPAPAPAPIPAATIAEPRKPTRPLPPPAPPAPVSA